MEDEFLEIVYSDEAKLQFDDLVNSDFGYVDEPDIYERLIAVAPERVGLEMGHRGKIYYAFMTRERPFGPPPIWISYKINREEHCVTIFDIRQHPEARSKRP
jgi:hypothetical protein